MGAGVFTDEISIPVAILNCPPEPQQARDEVGEVDWPEVASKGPVLNDGVQRRLALQRAAAAPSAGQDPTDPWLAPIVLDCPLFHHYSHMAYLLLCHSPLWIC